MLKANIVNWLVKLIIKDLEKQDSKYSFINRANRNCIQHLLTTDMYLRALSIKRREGYLKIIKRKCGELYGVLIEKLF